jgi:hypothetical protein
MSLSWRDGFDYALRVMQGHTHLVQAGQSGILTDVPMVSWVRWPRPPLFVESHGLVENLNAHYWSGYLPGQQMPLTILNYETEGDLPDPGVHGRVAYIKESSAVMVDVGVAWMIFAEEGTIDWDNILGKPSTFPPSSHTHTKSEITDFAHTHDAGDITSGILDESIGGFGKQLDLTGLDDGYILYYDLATDKFKVKSATFGGAAIESLTPETTSQTMSETISDSLTVTQSDS